MNKIAGSVLIGFPVKKSDFLVKAEILENSLCWHDILILTYILLRTMFLFYKITNYWRSFQSAALWIWTLTVYCKCILIVNFISRNVSCVVIYILWTFCYIVTKTWQTLLIYMINLLRWKHFHTTITIFSLLDTDQKIERNWVVELILV